MDNTKNEELFLAAEQGDLEKFTGLVAEGADPLFQRDSDGMSVLMVAARAGAIEIVRKILESGAPWNAIDRKGKCAGNYAFESGHHELANLILHAGVQAELVFMALEKRSAIPKPTDAEGNEYLTRSVAYEGTSLVDDDNRGVMMKWEQPLMELHAKMMCVTSGDVLNIGFGLGLIDTAIQQYPCKSHTIVEAHPQVYQKMLDDGWDKKPNVRIVFGRWQEVLDQLETYDGIFFDTFDDVAHMDEFHQHLPKLLRPTGVYSFFNGICPDNFFFQAVACEVIRIQLEQLGYDCQFVQVDVDAGDEDEWKDIKFRYFTSNQYHLPVVTKKQVESASTSEATTTKES